MKNNNKKQTTMQNAQTNNSNFTVENIVAKYRDYVSQHCPKSSELDEWVEKDGRGHYKEFQTPMSPYANAGEQLLTTIYKMVAGNNANKDIVDALSEYLSAFYSDALTENEMAFLCDHYKESVAYLFDHRDKWMSGAIYSLEQISRASKCFLKEYVKPMDGSAIFIANTEYCDLAVLFPNCIVKGFTGLKNDHVDNKAWALGEIRLFAADIKSEIRPTEESTLIPEYLSDVDYAILGRMNIFSSYEGTESVCQYMRPNGRLFLYMDRHDAAGLNETFCLRKTLVEDCFIEAVFSYEEEVSDFSREVLFVIASKLQPQTVHMQMTSGETFEVPANMLDHEILWPSYYAVKKPEAGIPLSSLVSIVDLDEERLDFKNGSYILPEHGRNMLVATPADLASEYKDANLCNANLAMAGDAIPDNWRWRIRQVEQPCILLYGRGEKYGVGYVSELPDNGIATQMGVICLIPKEGMDMRYVAALLLIPEVKHQIATICEGKVNNTTFSLIMNKVLVPNHDDKERLVFLAEANYEALNSVLSEKRREIEQYTKAIRMRKHALTQTLSSIEAMFYALNAYRIRKDGRISDDESISRIKGTTVKEAFEFLSQNIKDMMPTLEHIADVEYSFGKSEWIDPEVFIEDYINSNSGGWLNFKPIITWENGHNQAVEDIIDPSSGAIIIHQGESIKKFLFPKDALERICNNIVSNAVSHGFVDKSRCDYLLRFSWHIDGIALIIEIENNGSPIPEDRDTASLLEYGVSTNLHHDGHNGIGCNEIKDIMQRYGGRVEILSERGNDFPVKYRLIFNRSNTV